MTPQQRRAVIRALWTEHAPPTRTEGDIAAFHETLKARRPDLLMHLKKGDDPVKCLKGDLAGLYKNAIASTPMGTTHTNATATLTSMSAASAATQKHASRATSDPSVE
jgi:hypothetical protein